MGNKREKAKVGNGKKDPRTHACTHACTSQKKRNKNKKTRKQNQREGRKKKKRLVPRWGEKQRRGREVWFGSSGETNHNDGPVPPG